MKTLDQLTKDEISLLLFFETCAVDGSGRVKTVRMNDADCDIAKRWNEEGFVLFGRICARGLNAHGSHWCNLSADAWELAAAARKARAQRLWGKRSWETTGEAKAIAQQP